MAEEEARPRRRLGPLGILLGTLAVVAVLAAWNRAASSPRLCGSCHAMDPAVESAAGSIHADVPCLACHSRGGVLGSVAYLPTLAREGVQQLTGWDVASGVLPASTCDRCHGSKSDRGPLAKEHAGEGPPCATCHGNVTHPVAETPAPTTESHPERYDQTHGRDAAEGTKQCTTCHQQDFCTACHFRTAFPHPDGWIATHGEEQRVEGAQACALCHPSTFCVGCHGTEIPHTPTWLGEHDRALEEASTIPCYTCHPRTDCWSCHARHQVHREQDLYR